MEGNIVSNKLLTTACVCGIIYVEDEGRMRCNTARLMEMITPYRQSTPSPARNVDDNTGGEDKRSAKPP